MPAYYDNFQNWSNFDAIRGLKLSLDGELAIARARGESARVREIQDDLLRIRARADDPANSPALRTFIKALFGAAGAGGPTVHSTSSNASSIGQATSNAQSIDRGSACFSLVDDCPKFRITVKNNLSCKDVKIKTIKITCTDASIPDSLRPTWMNDSSIITPEIQWSIENAAQVEFSRQKNGFTLDVKKAATNGDLAGNSIIEGSCAIYDVVGSFKKKFSHALCVSSSDAGETFNLVNTELNRLLSEQIDIDEANTSVFSPIEIEVVEGI